MTTGTSDGGNLWERTCAERVGASNALVKTSVDLAIVGGGYTGCSAALAAAKAGASVCLLEADRIGSGGSGRNVGLVNAGLWTPPDGIFEVLGEVEGSRLLAHLAEAPRRVFDLIETHGIDCEPTRSGTLHCAHSPSGLKDLESRFRQQNRLGAPVRLLDAAEAARRTGSERFHGALFDSRAGTIQPLAFVRGLARAASEAGARIIEGAVVRRISYEGGAWTVEAGESRVTATSLLLATNAYGKGGPTGTDNPGGYVPVHYFQIATAPLPAVDRERLLPGGEGCWDTALVMSSFRLDRAGRLIVGGIGHLDGPGGKIHASWARRKIRELFPWLSPPPVEHGWSGRIAMTGDHLPKIREIGPRAYSCFGYSGRGIGPGTVFGTLAADALIHDEPDRLPLRPVQRHDERFVAAREGFYELGALATHAVMARRPGRLPDE